ncbi:MAG: DUF2293 domain-containing protein [Deltaproteobacteria bacterium]|nr:DUF2293 domain-containing protein [Deltaproteobacteria bacterium]
MEKSKDLKVFISNRESTCDECDEALGRKTWIILEEGKGALCLACADLDHLIFLPSGDTALTRRSRKYSTLVAVVLKWSRARKRYERQGLLVEEKAVEQAEQECLTDSEVRERRRKREAERRVVLDKQYVKRFSERLREFFPGCPPEREYEIAEHACRKYSGRIGRTADAKMLEAEAIRLAVIAHIRHTETTYDNLLAGGNERWEARESVRGKVEEILDGWENP